MRWKESYRIIAVIAMSLSTSDLAWAATNTKQDFFEEIQTESSNSSEPTNSNSHSNFFQDINTIRDPPPEQSSLWTFDEFVTFRVGWRVNAPKNPTPGSPRRVFGQYEVIAGATVDGSPHPDITLKLGAELRGDRYSNTADGLELKEAVLDARVNNRLGVKIGRQIISWGESNYFQLLDQINPRDLREPGFGRVEDLRLPVVATRLSYTRPRKLFEAVLIHEARSNRVAAKDESFYPYQNLATTAEIVAADNSFRWASSPEWMVRYFHTFANSDISIGTGVVDSDAESLRFQPSDNTLRRFVPQLTVFGVTANRVLGPVLLRGEYASLDGVHLPLIGGQTRQSLTHNFVFGIDYSVTQDIEFSTEWLMERFDSGADDFALPRHRFTLVTDIRVDLARDTQRLALQWRRLFQGDSSILKLSWSIEHSDTLSQSFGYIDYFSNDSGSALEAFDNEDRLIMDLKWNF